MSNQINITAHCPHCLEIVDIKPTEYVAYNGIPFPVKGECLQCGICLQWNPEDTYLTKFEPIGMEPLDIDSDGFTTISIEPTWE